MGASIIPMHRQELVNLASRIPESEIPAATRMLQSLLVDPMWLATQSAPVEEEELSAQGLAALAEGRAALERGDTVSHEEIRREFGLQSASEHPA